MNDDRFFDLAMKSIANQTTNSEQREFEQILEDDSRRAEFERLKAEVRLAREVLPIVNAMEGAGSELPGYARARLQTKVRQALGQPKRTNAAENEAKAFAWGWRWLLGLAATATAVILITVHFVLSAPEPRIQFAVLDLIGPTRGGDTNELAPVIESAFPVQITNFSSADSLEQWKRDGGHERGYHAKVVYDRSAAEVYAFGHGRTGQFTNCFLVDSDLRLALARVKAYLDQEMRK